MQTIGQPLSSADTTALKDFLDSSNRPDDTLRFHELQGFLFAIASSPETISPSEWIPMISNDEDPCYGDEGEAQQILNQIMTLYNEVNTSVLERSETLPVGCNFKTNVFTNFDEQASILQWSRGFTIGHDWLSEVWEEYLLEEMDEDCGATVMVLSFSARGNLPRHFMQKSDTLRTANPESRLSNSPRKFASFFQRPYRPMPISAGRYLRCS